MSDYKKGEPAPAGYSQWHAWAEAQYKAGLRQKQCKQCALWKFPQERDTCAACGSTADKNKPQ